MQARRSQGVNREGASPRWAEVPPRDGRGQKEEEEKEETT